MSPVTRRVSIIRENHTGADKHIIADRHTVGNKGKGLNLDAITNNDFLANPHGAVDHAVCTNVSGENYTFFGMPNLCST